MRVCVKICEMADAPIVDILIPMEVSETAIVRVTERDGRILRKKWMKRIIVGIVIAEDAICNDRVWD